jgi:hypothetical protein
MLPMTLKSWLAMRDYSVMTTAPFLREMGLAFGPFFSANILAAAFSAAVTIIAEGFAVTWPGKIDPSTTKRLSVPYTLVLRSTTAVPFAVRPSSSPILLVPASVESVSQI